MNIGIDVGYAYTKALCSGASEIIFPSVTCVPTTSMMNLDGARMSLIQYGKAQLTTAEYAVTYGGQRTESPDWVLGDEWKALLYTAIARTNFVRTRGVLVTGLPVADYARLKDKLRNSLLIDHTFTHNGKYYTFAPADVRVVPQAWGPILSLIFDWKGNKIADLQDERIAIIDIGGKTTNLLSVDGLMDVPAETKGLDLGTWHIIKAVRDFFDREHPGLNHLSDHRIVRAVRDGYIHYTSKNRVALRTVITPVVERMGNQIIEKAQQYWGQGVLTHQRMLVTGGGAYLLGKHIKKAFPHATVVDRPEFGNAQGYANFAAWVWKSVRKDE